MNTVNVPVSPGTALVTLQTGDRFAVAGAAVWFNQGAQSLEILVGNFQWDLPGGTFTVYSLTAPATVWICVSAPTTTPTGTPTTAPTGGTGVCPVCLSVAVIVPPATVGGVMPDLSLNVPTLRPAAPATTSTMQISLTVVVAAVGTLQAGLQTPAAALSTASARYSYTGGAELAGTVTTQINPALAWLSLVNPVHPAWQATGGPLWALAPLMLPVAPILTLMSLVVVWKMGLAIWKWLLVLVDLICKLIELIPGE